MSNPALIIWGIMFVLLANVAMSAVQAIQQHHATNISGYLVVTTCGTLPTGFTYPAASYQAGTQDITGKRC